MIYVYFYFAIGIVVTAISYTSYERKEKGFSVVVHDKLHDLRDDGSFSFQSANILGHLFAFTFSTLLWPTLVIKKILGC
jgi:hypothetical protein